MHQRLFTTSICMLLNVINVIAVFLLQMPLLFVQQNVDPMERVGKKYNDYFF